MEFLHGAELEYGDLDTRKGLPEGCSWSNTDYDLCCLNGLANDPLRKNHPYSGEINTPPGDIESQVRILSKR